MVTKSKATGVFHLFMFISFAILEIRVVYVYVRVRVSLGRVAKPLK